MADGESYKKQVFLLHRPPIMLCQYFSSLAKSAKYLPVVNPPHL